MLALSEKTKPSISRRFYLSFVIPLGLEPEKAQLSKTKRQSRDRESAAFEDEKQIGKMKF